MMKDIGPGWEERARKRYEGGDLPRMDMKLDKLPEGTMLAIDLVLNVDFTRLLRLRCRLATALMWLAAAVLGCEIEVNTEFTGEDEDDHT